MHVYKEFQTVLALDLFIVMISLTFVVYILIDIISLSHIGLKGTAVK